VTENTYDSAGRNTESIQDFTNATPTSGSNKTTAYTYGPAGMTGLTAAQVPGDGPNQTTAWVYGVTTGTGSTIDSNDIQAKTEWPDPTTGSASSSLTDTVTVDALGDALTLTDRNGNTHTYTSDVLGRQTADAVTTLGSGVDASVRRITTAYDSQGNPYLITSYNAASGGTVVSQVERTFNGFDQETADYQAVSGTVNTSSTPVVQYGYTEMSGGANNSRPTTLTYPNTGLTAGTSETLAYNYSSGLNNTISRLSSISDGTGTLESYRYLGLDTVVERDHSEDGVNLTYISQTGSTGDAGDKYTGLDRFGRVVDQNWYNTSTTSSTDDFQYGYDADGNVLYRNNTVNTAFGELYTYDGLNQISTFARGTLNGGHTGITGTPSRTQSWAYDGLGNMTSVTTSGTAQTRTANAENEVTGVSGATTPAYSANGDMTTDQAGLQYVYDAWNRLVTVKNSGGSTLETMTYDGLGRRVTDAESGTTTDLYYSSQGQVLEEDVGGVAVTRYVWSPVYVNASILRDRSTGGGTMNERLWVQQDANWDVTALVNGSSSVVERYAYDPFGIATIYNSTYSVLGGSQYGWLYLYQGMRLDTVSGLFEAAMRWYSPALQRWTTNDPVGYSAQDTNLYRFASNSPADQTDPSGLAVHISYIKVDANRGKADGQESTHLITRDYPSGLGEMVGRSPQGFNRLYFGFRVTVQACIDPGDKDDITDTDIDEYYWKMDVVVWRGHGPIVIWYYGNANGAYPWDGMKAMPILVPGLRKELEHLWAFADPTTQPMYYAFGSAELFWDRVPWAENNRDKLVYWNMSGFHGEFKSDAALAPGKIFDDYELYSMFRITATGTDHRTVVAGFKIFQFANAGPGGWDSDLDYSVTHPDLPHIWWGYPYAFLLNSL
jgi:RHS repeat-associated protein